MWTDKTKETVVLRIPSYDNEAFLLDNPIGFLHQVPYGSLPHQGWPIVGLDYGSLSFWRISGESIKLRGFYYHQIPFVEWADRQMRGRFISILSDVCSILTPEPIVGGRNPDFLHWWWIIVVIAVSTPKKLITTGIWCIPSRNVKASIIDGMVENQRQAAWTLSINIHSLNTNSFLEIETTDVRHYVWGGTGQPLRTKVQPVLIFFRRMETIK
jgi:hypothetical protein